MGSSRLPKELAAVVPCFNAGERIEGVVVSLLELLDRVIVVDDGCTDGCLDVLRELPVRFVSFPVNRGKGHALMAGYEAAFEDPSVSCVAALDADGQHDPAELPRLYSSFVEKEADFVIGARTFGLSSVPWTNRLGNRITAGLTSWLLGQTVPDTQSGYRLVSRKFVEAVAPEIRAGRYETEMELLARAYRGPFTVLSVPIETIYEEGNKSSHFNQISDSIRVIRTLLRTAAKTRGN